jgi:hypothetical protein
MRQLLDEPNRIRDEHTRLRLGVERAHRRIEGREELVRDQYLASGQRSHQRRLPRVGVADQRNSQLITACGPALVIVSLDIVQLLLQLSEAIPYLAAIEFEIGLTRAVALPPLSGSRRFPEAWRDVLQPRHLDLQLCLAAVRVPVEDLHDHPGPIKNLRTGCALKVACLAWRNLMIDNHEFRIHRLRIVLYLTGVELLVEIVKAVAGLRFPRYRHRSHDTRPAGHCGEILKPTFAEHRPAVHLVALLR